MIFIGITEEKPEKPNNFAHNCLIPDHSMGKMGSNNCRQSLHMHTQQKLFQPKAGRLHHKCAWGWEEIIGASCALCAFVWICFGGEREDDDALKVVERCKLQGEVRFLGRITSQIEDSCN